MLVMGVYFIQNLEKRMHVAAYYAIHQGCICSE